MDIVSIYMLVGFIFVGVAVADVGLDTHWAWYPVLFVAWLPISILLAVMFSIAFVCWLTIEIE